MTRHTLEWGRRVPGRWPDDYRQWPRDCRKASEAAMMRARASLAEKHGAPLRVAGHGSSASHDLDGTRLYRWQEVHVSSEERAP